MRFALHIDCNNAAFEGDPSPEVARILSLATKSIEAGYFIRNGDTLVIYDCNGNKVGAAQFEQDAA